MKKTEEKINTAYIGSFGEKVCSKFLKKNKYKILARNKKIGHLETDIIAYNKTHIVFVEVKTRRADLNNQNRPSSAVDQSKRTNLIHFANSYTKSLPEKLKNRHIRIDVCEVLIFLFNGKLKVEDINYIEGAISR